MKYRCNSIKPFRVYCDESSDRFNPKGKIEALDREIANRIERDHSRPGWW
jgi:hypothetical protein